MIDCVNLVAQIDLTGTENERKASVAYSLSKMTIIDEMEDFDQYNIMKRVEFLEFIARMAVLINPSKIPLVKKIEQLLGKLLEVVGKNLIYPNLEDGVSSESDCEDDLVSGLTYNLIK